MTTQQLLTEWLEVYEKERIKPRTYSRYHSLLVHHIFPCLGEVEIGQLGRRQVQLFLMEQKQMGNARGGGHLSTASINLMLTVLTQAFEYACDMELLEANPCVRLKRAQEKGKKVDAFTREEQRRIEWQIEEEGDLRLFGILLCMYSGLRIGELLGLEWADVDLEEGILTVDKTVYRERDTDGIWRLYVDTPKSLSSTRQIPLPPYILEQMRLQKQHARSPYVVENKKGARMSIRSYQYLFEKLTERAGVRKLNFHALRHTFATRALECGMDIKTLSELMGHQSASVTLNRYAHSMMDTKIEMMKKLPRII